MVVDIYESADAVKTMKKQRMLAQRGNQECKPQFQTHSLHKSLLTVQLEEIMQEADVKDWLQDVCVCCVCWLPSQCCA
ncbi:hypothetical protein AOLI_G00195270 [Acnodon oligacanthus]